MQQQGVFWQLFHSDYYAAAAARNLQDSTNYVPHDKSTLIFKSFVPVWEWGSAKPFVQLASM